MSVVKNKRGTFDVYVYSPEIKRKKYVGTRKLERDAKALFRERTAEFKGDRPGNLTINAYATQWLEIHHGKGTKRPEHGTYVNNEQNLRAFLKLYGQRLIDGGIGRQEALKWAKEHPTSAKTVSAMFNDAIDDEQSKGNPFANRRHQQSRERKDIAPITEAELDTLANLALKHWGEDGYGIVARAWVLFAAWVGCRPGETFSVPLKNLNFHTGEVRIRRVKKRAGAYPTDTVVLPDAAADAVRDALPFLATKDAMFRTVTGAHMKASRGSLPWHWNPIAAAFRGTMSEERWQAITEGQKSFQPYFLRHFAASIIVERGGNEFDCAAQLGNSPQVCRETYIHAYIQRANERNRRLLNGPTVVGLDELRERRGA